MKIGGGGLEWTGYPDASGVGEHVQASDARKKGMLFSGVLLSISSHFVIKTGHALLQLA